MRLLVHEKIRRVLKVGDDSMQETHRMGSTFLLDLKWQLTIVQITSMIHMWVSVVKSVHSREETSSDRDTLGPRGGTFGVVGIGGIDGSIKSLQLKR